MFLRKEEQNGRKIIFKDKIEENSWTIGRIGPVDQNSPNTPGKIKENPVISYSCEINKFEKKRKTSFSTGQDRVGLLQPISSITTKLWTK